MADQLEEKPVSRRQRERMFRADLVIDAALEVFMESPFVDARMEDIAERAELSVGTLYNLFESKEDIYKATVSRQQDRFFERVNREIDSTNDPVDQTRRFISTFFQHVADNFSAWRFHVYASAGMSATVRNELLEEVQVAQSVFLRRLARICQTGIDRGVFRSGLTAELMAVAINSVPHSCLGVAFQNNDADVMVLVPSAVEAVDRITGAH
jgi:TetR/AcrR family transcriptional regulator